MYQRHLKEKLAEALSDSPVVLLNGARQTGKTTLVHELTKTDHPARYVTFDDTTMLAAAKHDPTGFLSDIEGSVVLDEIQRVPELFPAIKLQVDQNRKAGRFLLTGSANVLLLPRLSESLTGRMETLTLWPLSQGEIESQKESFIDALFRAKLPWKHSIPTSRTAIQHRFLRGGYPEVIGRVSEERRHAWCNSYLNTILQRDIRDLAHIEGLTDLPRLMSLLATRGGSLLNFAELSRAVGIPQSTLKRYMTLLETTFLIQRVPPWFSNLGKRLVKTPKLFLTDTGLMSFLTGVHEAKLGQDSTQPGSLLENFVCMELRKQMGWNQTRVSLFHYRTQAGEEVDFLLEANDGRMVGIEVKSSSSVSEGDFRGLRSLEAALGKKFHRGVVLYCGSECVSFEPKLQALPIPTLWLKE